MNSLSDFLLGAEIDCRFGKGIVVGINQYDLVLLNNKGNKIIVSLMIEDLNLTNSLNSFLTKRKIKTLDWNTMGRTVGYPVPEKGEYVFFFRQEKCYKFIHQLKNEPQMSWYKNLLTDEVVCDNSVFYGNSYYVISKEPIMALA